MIHIVSPYLLSSILMLSMWENGEINLQYHFYQWSQFRKFVVKNFRIHFEALKNHFCGIKISKDLYSIIYTIIPSQWHKNHLNWSSYEKVMPRWSCGIVIDHHNLGGCHANPYYSWKWVSTWELWKILQKIHVVTHVEG